MNKRRKQSWKGTWMLLIALGIVVFVGAFLVWTNGVGSRNANANATPVRDGLIAYWALDNGSGTTVTDDQAEFDGFLIGTPEWTDGRRGGALEFDGVGDEVSLPPLQLTEGTIAAWVKWDKKSAVLAGKDYDEGYWLFFDEQVGGVGINWGGKHRMFRDIFETGVWTHVAMTRRDTVLTLYKDGELQEVNENGVSDTATVRGIGALYAGVGSFQRFDGQIDEVRIYNRPLTAPEVRALYEYEQR